MLAADVIELLESGCALIVGLVTPEGLPFATRGWGLMVFDQGRAVRVLLPSSDLTASGRTDSNLVGATIAVTGTSVPTFRSVQVKGRVTAVEAPNRDDQRRMERYADAFLGDVEVVDRFPRSITDRLLPAGVTAVELTVAEVYDQTPGPRAGAAVTAVER